MTEWVTDLVDRMGYAGIALLMFLENVFPPIPSEVIMPMAGFVASEGRLNIVLVLLSGLGGTLAGAIFWYAIGRWVNEDRLKRWADRHGRWITLSGKDIGQLEDRFERHSSWSVPVAHLIPGLRTLISIPAGIFEMPPFRFLILTMIGAGVWTGALGLAGYWLGKRFEAIERWLGPAGSAIMAAMLIYYVWRVVRFKPG